MRFFIIFFPFVVVGASISVNFHIESAIKNFVLNQSIDIQFFIESQNDFNLNFLIKSIVATVAAASNPITVSVGKLIKSQRNQLVIMLIDDLFNKEIKWRVNDFYLILPTKSNGTKMMAKFFNHIWEQRIVNINVIMSDGNVINLLTFFPFTNKGCLNGSNIRVINRFIDNTWETREFFPPKLKNFHRYALKLGIQQSAPAAERIMKRDHTYEYVGSDIEIADEFARIFNFTNNFIFDNWWGEVYENESGDYNLGKLLRKEIDYVVGWHFLNLIKSKFLDYTQPYYFVPFIIIVPSGTPYTSLENLMRCFTPSLWASFIASCSLFYIIFFIINYFIKRHSLPIMHFDVLLIIILGESTSKHYPTRNSIRLIVMTFIIFCFIIRTVYVSEMFNLLQSGSNNRDIDSLDDLREKKYTLFTPSFIESYISLTELKYDRKYIKILENFDDENKIKQVFDPSFRGAFVEPLDIVIRANKNSSTPYNILSQPLSMTPVVIYFQKNSYLRNIFDEKLQHLHQAGLIDLWISQQWKSKTVRNNVEAGNKEPKVLSLNQLSAAFTICIGGILLSLIVFVAEIYYIRLKKKKFNRDVARKQVRW